MTFNAKTLLHKCAHRTGTFPHIHSSAANRAVTPNLDRKGGMTASGG